MLITEAELENQYLNKVVQLNVFTKEGEKKYYGKVDRVSLDTILHNPPIVILILDGTNRFEVELEDIEERITILN